MNCLIGHTGFVGSNILEQGNFDKCYNSKNITDIDGMKFDLLVCAGVSGLKWKANKHPQEDYEQIINLISHLNKVEFKKMVLISTGSVYDNPADNAYGSNRLYLETYLLNNFKNVSIVRLPSLFGKNLRKNSLYDLLNSDFDYLPNIKSTFQYYDLGDIWSDITIVLDNKLKVVNFGTEPLEFSKILDLFSFESLNISDDKPILNEDVQTIHAHNWGRNGKYLYSKEEIFNKLKKFVEVSKNEKRN